VPVRSGMLVHSGMLVRSGMLGRAPQGARRLTRAAAAALVLLGPTLAGCRSGGAPAPAVGETPPDELVVSAPCVPSGPELCFNGVDDNCNGLLEEGCGIPSGLVQFVAAWSEPDVDVDLHVTDPNGEVAEVGHVTAGGLTKQHDCPGKQNLCYGQNFENVYLDGDDATRRERYERFLTRAVALRQHVAPDWRRLWETRPLEEARRTGQRLDEILAGEIAMLTQARVASYMPDPEPVPGMCGRLGTYLPEGWAR